MKLTDRMNIFKAKKASFEDSDGDTPEYLEKLQYRVRSPQHKRFSGTLKDGKVEKQSSKELDYLPDGSHLSPLKSLTKNDDGLSAVRRADVSLEFLVCQFPHFSPDVLHQNRFVPCDC